MSETKSHFGTKAETLARLYAGYPELNTPRPCLLPFSRWKEHPGDVLAELRGSFPRRTRLAVRSSCRAEDTAEHSNAGAFHSRLDIPLDDEAALSEAVDAVFASYGSPRGEHLLIQPMVRAAVSGVIMTRALDDGSPYYVINYDDESRRTDTVTGGSGVTKTVYVYKGVRDSDFDSERVRTMVRFARSLEAIFSLGALDIEFGMEEDGTMHLFQVRPISGSAVRGFAAASEVSDRIRYVEAFVRERLAPRSGLYGTGNILGVMPDWNPAEIIGVTPRPLAASLYREAVTRRVWSLAREEMGYRTMPPEELMVLIAGRPYIDVRSSFNSFLPEGVVPESGRRLVDAMLARLDDNPELHDKVEFEVAFTVVDFDTRERLRSRYPGILGEAGERDFLVRLTALTRRALDLSPSGSMAGAEARIERLEALQRLRPAGEDSTGDDPAGLLVRVRTLLEECCRLGTQPFSVLARHGFIAESLLRSAVRRGALAPERVAALKQSVPTVSSEFSTAFAEVCAGRGDRAAFLKRFGHLRPGTYDILSPSYAERENLFDGHSPPRPEAGQEPFVFSAEETRALNALLRESGLGGQDASGGADAGILFEYIRRAVAGREYGKFVFTRNLSDILDSLARWGESRGLDRETVSLLTVPQILDSLTAPALTADTGHFRELAEANERTCALGRSLKLSYLIRSPRDVYIVPQHRSAPNYITAGRVEAPVVSLDAASGCDARITGKIVCIESADPGFDWIFARGIAGLVTKYGGANSHMAIRCAEYGIPAAIGCGEMLFGRVARASRCLLNPGGCSVVPADGS